MLCPKELAELRGLKRMQKDALDALRLQLEGQLQDKEVRILAKMATRR